MFFSKNLKYLRKHQKDGISQEKLAKDIGITRAAIMAYESRRAEPKLLTLNKLARYFDISLERLINVDLENVDFEQKPAKEESRDEVPPFIVRIWGVRAS